eukprot:CAMPEP_0172481404 /NCGR_PEP_ID=MMETSP1066-20121228/7224_1 /TAXON_ID=671091 /ORGANISM="Coscinodiscus wailesii, Strain CCMP2513" /LENGTH=122 /DNA_ID=CAMNT_0013243643 /DNA_START=71 /DNA_END=436 /DNA_ORIENTATION=+
MFSLLQGFVGYSNIISPSYDQYNEDERKYDDDYQHDDSYHGYNLQEINSTKTTPNTIEIYSQNRQVPYENPLRYEYDNGNTSSTTTTTIQRGELVLCRRTRTGRCVSRQDRSQVLLPGMGLR